MTDRKYTIFFLTQEEPASGNAKDREILSGCPSMGSIEFTSNAESYGKLLRDFKNFMKDNVSDSLASTMNLPPEDVIKKYWDHRADTDENT